MSTKPILFNTEMVRDILDGRKAVTRRVVKPQPRGKMFPMPMVDEWPNYWRDESLDSLFAPPYHPGDILYVRETWAPIYTGKGPDFVAGYMYRADEGRMTVEDYDRVHPEGKDWTWPGRWYPSIHMPREAARIFLRVTDVRVERLQDISVGQAIAEGITEDDILERDALNHEAAAKWLYEKLWDSTIKPADRGLYSWAANPWVWVIEFERISKEEAASQ